MTKLTVWFAGCLFAWFIHAPGFAGFVSRRYSDAELEAAAVLAVGIRSKHRNDEKTKRAKMTPKVTAQRQWYQKISFSKTDRFSAIGKLFIVPVKSKFVNTKLVKNQSTGKLVKVKTGTIDFDFFDGFEYRHCSAFYVAPKLLATAAHCLRDNGVTEDSEHVVLFRKQYDGKKPYDDVLADENERIITEWVYADLFNKAASAPKEGGGEAATTKAAADKDDENDELRATEPWDYASGFDIAFLKTNDKGEGQNEYYVLKSPNDIFPELEIVKKKKGSKKDSVVKNTLNKVFGARQKPSPPKILIVGYPQEYADWFVAVGVECSLVTGYDDMVIKDPGIRRSQQKHPGTQLSSIAKNQLFCVGEQGAMGVGGSGGPLLLDEGFVNEIMKRDKSGSQKKEKLPWVIGLFSWGPARIVEEEKFPTYREAFWDSQKYCKVSVSPWIRSDAIEIYDVVKKASLEDMPFKEALEANLKLGHVQSKKD